MVSEHVHDNDAGVARSLVLQEVSVLVVSHERDEMFLQTLLETGSSHGDILRKEKEPPSSLEGKTSPYHH